LLHAVYSSLADARCDIKQLLTPVRRGPPLAHEPGCYTAVSRSRPGPWRSDNWEPVRSGRGAGVSSLAPELPSLPRMQTSGSSAFPEMQCRTGPRAAKEGTSPVRSRGSRRPERRSGRPREAHRPRVEGRSASRLPVVPALGSATRRGVPGRLSLSGWAGAASEAPRERYAGRHQIQALADSDGGPDRSARLHSCSCLRRSGLRFGDTGAACGRWHRTIATPRTQSAAGWPERVQRFAFVLRVAVGGAIGVGAGQLDRCRIARLCVYRSRHVCARLRS